MSGFLAVLKRELVERRLLLVAGLAAGLCPLIVPLLPGAGGRNSAELRGATAMALGLVMAAALALGLGASVIAGDLSERRLGFYFSRPIAGWAVWAGKLAGAAIVAATAGLLVLLPSLLLGDPIELGAPWWWPGSPWLGGFLGVLLLLLAGAVAVVAVSHVLSSMARSRSPWLLLDLAAALALAGLVWSCWRVLAREDALVALLRGVAGLGVVLVAAALAAGAVQVTAGRTDVQRGHRLLSLTLWAALGLAGLGFAAYSRWVVTAGPADLADVFAVVAAPRGSWIVIQGPARGRFYAPAFLLDTSSGRWVKLEGRSTLAYGLPVLFSADGTRAVWLARGQEGDFNVRTLDLTRPGARAAAPPISFNEPPRDLALSPQGTLLAAVAGNGTVTVEDVTRGGLLASDTIPAAAEASVTLRFDAPDRLRIVSSAEELTVDADRAVHRLTVLTLRIPRGRIAVAARSELAGGTGSLAVSPDGERALLRGRRSLHLLDLRSGAPVAELPLGLVGITAHFLEDGRIVYVQRMGGHTELQLLTRDGAPLRRFAFSAPRLLVGGELAPGRLVLATARHRLEIPGDPSSFLLDLDSGRMARIGHGLMPAAFALAWRPYQPQGGVEGLGARLFLRARGDGRDLVLLDPRTGRLRTLVSNRFADGS